MSDSAGAVMPRLRAALAEGTRRLGEAGIVSASVEARTLVQAAACADGPLVLLDDLPEDFEARIDELLTRRARRMPLQLILGTAPFRRLVLHVEPGVFIPRPETELAIDLVLEHARHHPVRRVLDLGTGSGALAAAVLDELPDASVLALDVDPAAARLAARNLELTRGAGRGRVEVADLRDAAAVRAAVGGRNVDVVLSNPPYIPPDAVPADIEVRDHDPALALYGGGPDGLSIPAAVLERAVDLLTPGGLLVMEHADVQGPATRALAERTGALTAVRTHPDLAGRDRFLVARRRGSEKLAT
ncbi:MAG: peptide chain release factor N(5)-glutamine methyltransferase [Brachybacterium sp.]|nr:peptide chain release factor N(5)-glutamine methyltransferase [Brachybacterium sp.]